jgi:hypothetical protein
MDLENGQLIRELTLDPIRDYRPIGQALTVRYLLRHVSGMT